MESAIRDLHKAERSMETDMPVVLQGMCAALAAIAFVISVFAIGSKPDVWRPLGVIILDCTEYELNSEGENQLSMSVILAPISGISVGRSLKMKRTTNCKGVIR